MKINNKFIGFLTAYFGGVGGFAFLITVINALIGYEMLETALTAVTVAFVPVAAVTVLILRDGLDSFELWSRRIINALFDITCITLSFVAFGVFSTSQQIAISFLIGITGNLAVTVPLFIILDRRKKNDLDKINKKLKENDESAQGQTGNDA